MSEHEINIRPLADLSMAVPGDAVYKNGQLFGCIFGWTQRGVIVAIDKDYKMAAALVGYPETKALKVLSVEVTKKQVDTGIFEVYARDPVPEFPNDEHWADEWRVEMDKMDNPF